MKIDDINKNKNHLNNCKKDNCFSCDLLLETYSYCVDCNESFLKNDLNYRKSTGDYQCDECNGKGQKYFKRDIMQI